MFALGIALTFFAIYTYQTDRHYFIRNAYTSTKLIAYNSKGALLFNDKRSAEQIMEGLSLEPSIHSATLLYKNGTPLAHYNETIIQPVSPLSPFNQELTWSFLTLSTSIQWKGQMLGTIVIRYSLKFVNDKLFNTIFVSLLVLCVGVLLAVTIARGLHGYITAPLDRLIDAVRSIAKNKDYSHRITNVSNDEVGFLIENFNFMLSEIQKRDTSLESAVASAQAASPPNQSFLPT